MIPPNALAADTIITVELRTRPVSRSPAGPVVAFGPAGTELRREARLSCAPRRQHRHAASEDHLTIEAEEQDGGRWTLPGPGTSVRPGRFVHTDVQRLDTFQIGRRLVVACRPSLFLKVEPSVAQSKVSLHLHQGHAP